ncbi:phage integrase N-terminal SAM-like domain-containing protein [Draconibacterium sp.]|nr:phage integrase N-terminal SAM-like domain-containing protein [Draconibacterium sp.]
MSTRPKIKLEYGIHRQQQVVFVRFAFNQDIINRLKETTPARWSATKGCWYILSEKLKLNSFFESFKGIAYINYSELKKHQEKACKKELSPKKNLTPKIIVELPPGYLEKLEQLRRSPNTIKIYTSYFKDFTRHFNKRDLVQIDHDEINSYITGLIREYRISSSQQNQRINAIKFFYEQVLGKKNNIMIFSDLQKKENYPIY